MMSAYDLRKNYRRVSKNRRMADRRHVPYAFGSRDWVENITNHYLAWPRFDRRDNNRRNHERRGSERRLQQFSEQRRSEQKYSPILLTQEERKLIEDLYLSGMD